MGRKSLVLAVAVLVGISLFLFRWKAMRGAAGMAAAGTDPAFSPAE